MSKVEIVSVSVKGRDIKVTLLTRYFFGLFKSFSYYITYEEEVPNHWEWYDSVSGAYIIDAYLLELLDYCAVKATLAKSCKEPLS